MGNKENVKKIAIIGGGIAGLSAAYLLEKEAADNGLSIEIDLIEKKKQDRRKYPDGADR